MSVSVKEIVIKIGKKEVKLTLDQAVDLQRTLNLLLGSGTTIVYPTLPCPYPHITWTSTSDEAPVGPFTVTIT